MSDCLAVERSRVRRLVVLAAASDGSSDLASVFIHVTTVDDHPPRFTASRKDALITEGAPRGTVVARLPAVLRQHHAGSYCPP